jgi:hypothetical protein
MPGAIDPVTGWLISPIVVAALCMKPHGLLRTGQAAKVAALKSALSEFVTMCWLAMRFRGILRSKNAKRLDGWLNDAQRSGIYDTQRFARTLRDLRRQECSGGTVEQWPNRAANQSIEISQASHVRPRRRRTVASPYDAATVIHGARIVRQIPITGDNNIFATDKGIAIRSQQLAMMLNSFAHACPH